MSYHVNKDCRQMIEEMAKDFEPFKKITKILRSHTFINEMNKRAGIPDRFDKGHYWIEQLVEVNPYKYFLKAAKQGGPKCLEQAARLYMIELNEAKQKENELSKSNEPPVESSKATVPI